jgi:hypothetical protein
MERQGWEQPYIVRSLHFRGKRFDLFYTVTSSSMLAVKIEVVSVNGRALSQGVVTAARLANLRHASNLQHPPAPKQIHETNQHDMFESANSNWMV